jgi:hypothetical protein
MIRHPLTKAEYRKRDDGLVAVTGIDGVVGIFDRDGRWISGQRRDADAALCFWVASGIPSSVPVNLVHAQSGGAVPRESV